MAEAAPDRDLAAFRAQRDAYIDTFRRTGERPAEPAIALEAALRAAVEAAPAGERAALWQELAAIVRIQGRFDEAIPYYRAAIEAAGGRGKVAFDAWIGIARAHAYGDKDHGAAAAAYTAAVEAAGSSPSRKQRYDMADYLAQLQDYRGELEAALVNALDSIRLAGTDEERFYAQFNAGGVLDNFADSCDYRQLVDAKSETDAADESGWGACRRAVAAAKAHFVQAGQIAAGLGWDFLGQMTDESGKRLDVRLFLIEERASMEGLSWAGVFDAEDATDVLVNESFEAGASTLGDVPGLTDALAGVVAEAAQAGDLGSLAVYLAGLQADVAGDPATALALYEEAVALLERERASLFDLRQRGTVVEDQPEVVVNLALRLLTGGGHAAAFSAFESIRARGLGDLAAAFDAETFTDAERGWLAGLVELDSQESAILASLVEDTIAGETGDPSGRLDELASVRARRAAAHAEPGFADTLARVAQARGNAAGLAEITEAVQASGVPVIFYWTTATNVVVWAVSPVGMEVKTVFLPAPALIEKVRRVVQSARTPDQPYDAEAARQLHAYLIEPFERHLAGGEAILVPQGPLVALPFEALIDGRTGDFLVERLALSYAPSAAFALAALQRDALALPPVTAVYDAEVEPDTGEIGRLERRLPGRLQAASSQSLAADGVIARLSGAPAAHVLLHGNFESADPLQSFLGLNLDLPRIDPENRLTAAELLAVNWKEARLVVFAACESAQMNVRISNEIYGLSWAPLAGGGDAVVTSRWRAEGKTSAEWMPDFYARLAEGKGSPAAAAAATMRRMIDDGEAHPYYWAAPQVFGR